MGRARKVVAAIAVATLIGGCTTSGPDGGGPRPTASSTQTEVPSAVVETRRVTVSAPGMAIHTVEFVSATHGYALLLSDDPVTTAADPEKNEYRAALFATTDGGQSWIQRRHPRPVGPNQNMFAAADTVMVNVAYSDWYISTDTGRTFRHTRPGPAGDVPPEYTEAFADPLGPYRMECGRDGCLIVVRRADGRTVPVPTQPRVGRDFLRDLRLDRDGRLWVAGLDRDRPVVVMSEDGGRTWQRRDPPAQKGASSYYIVRFVTSPDGSDLWLVAAPTPQQMTAPAGAVGRSVRLRKEIGLPHLWRAESGDWVVRGAGASRPPSDPDTTPSVAALGGDLLMVESGSGAWLVDDEWTTVALPERIAFVNGLRDGTIVAMVDQATRLLGTWDGRAFAWVRVTLTVGR